MQIEKPTLVSGPAERPVSLLDVKRELLVEHDDDDDLIEAFIESAVSYLDGYAGILGRALVSQVWRQRLSDWPDFITLPFPDVSLVDVSYTDADGQSQVVASGLYELVEFAAGTRLVFRDEFKAPELSENDQFPVRIDMTIGFGAASDVPAALRHAMIHLIAHWYQNRATAEEKAGLPMIFCTLIAPYRSVGI